MTNKIKDFGEKIGGARKDLWENKRLNLKDLSTMNQAEKEKYVKKQYVWPKPDYQALADRTSVRTAFFIKQLRDAIPALPIIRSRFDNYDEVVNEYVETVGNIRDAALNIQSENEVMSFYDRFMKNYIENGYFLKDSVKHTINYNLLKASNIRNWITVDQKIIEKEFLYNDQMKEEKQRNIYNLHTPIYELNENVSFEKMADDRIRMGIRHTFGTNYVYLQGKNADMENFKHGSYMIVRGNKLLAKNLETKEAAEAYRDKLYGEYKQSQSMENKESIRKKKYIPPQLQHIQRDGPEYRTTSATGEDYLKTFGFKGGEYGNWVNDVERQASLDYGYDALMDLSRALEIDPKDISIGNRLSIAFGARGHGSALAHYEPMREVINLTKLKGAGSLAHEWGHALDDIAGKHLGANGYMTVFKCDLESIRPLIDTMRFKTVINEDILQEQKDKFQNRQNLLRANITPLFRESNLTDERIAEKNDLIEKYVACNDQVSIDDLSNFRKQTIGKVIPKGVRDNIDEYRKYLQTDMNSIGKPKKEKTDFYKRSIAFDQQYAKESDYWQSKKEMFARAFACYVSDRLDYDSDYLVGHVNMDILEYPEPHGEERENINKCFDQLIQELKEKEILHHAPTNQISNDLLQTSEELIQHIEYFIESDKDLENVKKDFEKRLDEYLNSRIKDPFLISVHFKNDLMIDKSFINSDIAENMKMAADWNGRTLFQEFIECNGINQNLEAMLLEQIEFEEIALKI